MPLIYITGISGSGKSTVRQELLHRGFKAYGGAEDKIAAFYNNETGKKLGGWVEAKNRTPEWRLKYSWKIDRRTIQELKKEAESEPIFLCAITRNDIAELWDLFDHVFALTLDEETLKHRLATRINNDVGKNPHELATLLQWQQTAAEEYQKLGATLIDATRPLQEVVDEIVQNVTKT